VKPLYAWLVVFAAIVTQGCSATGPQSQPLTHRAIDPPGLFAMPGFHQVMATTGRETIYVAGQVAYDENMKLVGIGDYRAQTIQALGNVILAIRAAGAEPEDIVSSTLYIRGLNAEAAQEIMAGMAVALEGQPFPAHAFSMIGVETLADSRILIEVSAIASN